MDELGEPLAQVLKTMHSARGGKISVARVFRGVLKDGMTLNGERVSGLFRLLGNTTEKVEQAGPGDVVGLGRLEKARTGDTLAAAKGGAPLPKADVHPPVYALAMAAADQFSFAPVERLGTITTGKGYLEKHIQAVLGYPLVKPEDIARKKLSVVVDAINSTGALFVPPLLKALGVQFLPGQTLDYPDAGYIFL